ncbi:E3 ubiquitin-protein ligase TRAIP isoform X2 [Gouania willdenowi]|uniref:E3 ubiquitin-protein ligase TRAIP isoform X2 n=1 Tax=Gouania willdenowi TaxID=441366 RepID=UPI0010557C92|nr:E3 ubiquitin-protein ligase TRAIP isoform X2 [Gouania willdenowi]
MPIRANCTICSDYFDHSRDVAAIHCGHTFHYECLLQWFQTAPTKTCPQCRKQVSTRHIINKLFFDVGTEAESTADPDSLQNELDRIKVVLSKGDREWRDRQKMVDSLKEMVAKQKKDLDSMRKEVMEKDMLCSTLKMKYLETKNSEVQAAMDEVRRLRTKMKTYESLDVVLQGQRSEVESMIADMGVSQAAVEQLSIYCISLKKEYDSLKGSLRSSNDMCEKLKREVLSTNNKMQKATLEVKQTKENMQSLQKDLTSADHEISSLKKKVEFLQKTLSTPTRTNEVLNRLVFESPAPVELKQPHLHRPKDSDDIDLNVTFDVTTPDDVSKRPSQTLWKKMRLDTTETSASKLGEKSSTFKKARDEEATLDPFVRNSLLFRKKTFGGMLDPQRKAGTTVQSGYDGLGGRTKFFQPSPLAEIRPLIRGKRKKVVRPPPPKVATALTLDSFLE